MPGEILDATREELENFQKIARALRPSPGELPELPGIDVAGTSLPLRGDIGGDHVVYLDFDKRFDLGARIELARTKGDFVVARQLERQRRRAGVMIADVAGHRITDAVIAAMLHQAFLIGVGYELEIYGEITTRLFEAINTRFYKSSNVNKYVTMLYGEVTARGRFRYISAGHPVPGAFSAKTGRMIPLPTDEAHTSQPIGVLPSEADVDRRVHGGRFGYKRNYRVNELRLAVPGDTLLLLTDGFAEHADGAFYPDRVEQLLRRHVDASAERLVERLVVEIDRTGPREDGISFVLIRRRPPNAAS